jgi:hypothetical protein
MKSLADQAHPGTFADSGKVVLGMDDEARTDIVWLPHEANEGEYIPAPTFTTFGSGGGHVGNPDLVYVPELTGPEFSEDGKHRNPWGLDPEIAGLIIALNAAGITTVQSCQEITDPGEDIYGDMPRMGIVVVEWGTFPLLTKTLPGHATGDNREDGWLFAADSGAEHVSVIFPWRDLEAWLSSIKAAEPITTDTE